MNPYLQQLLDKHLTTLSDDSQKCMQDEAMAMDGIGVKSSEDHKNFMAIRLHLPKIAKELSKTQLTTDQLATLSAHVFENIKKFPINTILNFYYAVENALKESGMPIKKMAYPQDGNSIYVAPPYNVKKWLEAMREVYAWVNKGQDKTTAFDKITSNWDKMERLDFKNWMHFYEEGNHKKYVTAQQYSVDNYVIPMDNLKAKLPTAPAPDMNEFKHVQHLNSTEEKKKLIEDQRGKITARLNAAEKILCTYEGRTFAGKEFDEILQALHTLKRLIQSANKLSVASSLFEDLIVKHANIFSNGGFKKSASFLYKIADTSPIPEIPTALPTIPVDDEDPYKKFLKSLDLDHSEVNDEAMAEDELVVEAQVAPEGLTPKIPAPVEKPVMPALKTLPVEENKPSLPENEDNTIKSDDPKDVTSVDTALENALNHVKIEDVIKRLEALSNIFKTREIGRRLSVVDLMLDKLNLGSFFPALGEAIKSSLDSNSYCLTRISDILDKLRGSLPSQKIDLEGKEKSNSPIANHLQTQQDKEKSRKELRKAKNDADLEKPDKIPDIVTNVPEQLSKPVAIEKPVAPPIKL